MSDTFNTVADIIAETCDIPREKIKPESHAIDDLEIDSLDFLDIAFAVDKAFGIKLPLEQWTQEVNDGSIRVESVVPTASTVFEGHFPGHPLLPGVLLIETMAQTAGWIILAHHRFERMPFLAGVRAAKLRRFVSPGERLSVDGRIIHEGSGFAVASCQINADGKAVCDAELTFRILPFPNPEIRADLEAAAARIGFPLEALSHAG